MILNRVSITIEDTSINLENEDRIITLCRDLAGIAHLNVLKEGFARFEKQGASAFLVLSQSHLAIHTWPEYRLAYVDILSSKDIAEDEILGMKKYFMDKNITLLKFGKTLEDVPTDIQK